MASTIRRVVIDGAGHFPQRERPDAVARALIEFFKDGNAY
jgi:pimeloyl-ACP methyl ester carboxylesterase